MKQILVFLCDPCKISSVTAKVQFPENQRTAGNVDAPEAPPQPQNPGVQGEQALGEQVQVIQGQAPAQGAQPPEGELEVIKNELI